MEHTFEDVYASSAPASERPTGVRLREAGRRSTPGEHPGFGPTAWPFCTPAFVTALDLTRDAVLIVDRSGTIRYANAACKALVGRRSRAEGKHLLDIMGVDSRVLRCVLRGLRETGLWRGNATVILQGNPSDLELCVGAVKLEDRGRAHGFSVIVRPIEATRESQALRTRSGARDVFATLARVASAVAHDFNNHISVVLNYSFILLRELPSERPERGHMEELQHAAWRAAETARRLLRFGGKRGPEPAALDANDVIRGVHTTLAMIAQREVEQRLSQTPCLVKARQSELEWLLLELTEQLRSRLGDLEHVRITTEHASNTASVRIVLDGIPGAVQHEPLRAASSRLLPSEPDPHDAGPKLGVQLVYELSLHALPDNGLRYTIELASV